MLANTNGESSKTENPNELDIPKWIYEDYFHDIVAKDVENFVSIRNLTSIAATPPNENFNSIMVRVIMDIELKGGGEQNVCYILKIEKEEDNTDDSYPLFPKENQMYQVHIPNFTRLYKEAGMDIELAPRCIHVDETPERTVFVLEDLKRRNYKNVDRLKGFDMEYMRRALHKIAELHAASAVTYEQNGPYDEIYNKSVYIGNLLRVPTEEYVKAMREWQLPDVEKYIKKIRSEDEYYEIRKALSKVDETEFNVLNHGDLWCNNIMFSKDRTLLLDFQLVTWGSPVQDLWNLITLSCSLDIKISQFDNFIEMYHSRLEECLKLLKYSKPLPTLRELHIMMIKYGDFGLILAIGGPLKFLLQSPGPNIECCQFKLLMNPYFVKAIVQLYPFLNNKGIL